MLRHLLMAALVAGFLLGGAGTAAAAPTAPAAGGTTFDVGVVSPLIDFLPTDELDSGGGGGDDDDGGGGSGGELES